MKIHMIIVQKREEIYLYTSGYGVRGDKEKMFTGVDAETKTD